MFGRFINWITLKDYESARTKATVDIVKRFSRGNTAVQNGDFLDSDGLRELSLQGDAAMRGLKKRSPPKH
jgi:hypothetical protein